MKIRRTVLSTVTEIGVQKFMPFGSWDGADQPLTENPPSTTVKLAVGAWISSSRTADVVTRQLGPCQGHRPLTPEQPMSGGSSF